MPRVVLIVNPYSTGVTRDKVDQVEAALRGVADVERRQTEGRGHATELASAAADSADAIVVFAGDGTYNEAVNGGAGRVPFGFVPGGGASVYYSDAVVARGGRLANYAEYSGDPPDWAVEVLTEKVCSLPRIKHIIVGGAIANFTDVKKTFGGIIAGFRKAKVEGKLNGVQIWVRRGGPREKEGLEAMRALRDEGFDIHVFDRHTPLTDIVDLALQKK